MQQAKSHFTNILISHFAKAPQSQCLLLHTLFICTGRHVHKIRGTGNVWPQKMAPITPLSKFVPKKYLHSPEIIGEGRQKYSPKSWQIRDFAAQASTRPASWPVVFLIFTNHICKRGIGEGNAIGDFHLSSWRAAHGLLPSTRLASPPLPIVWKRDHLGRDSSAMHTANSYDKPETAASHALLDHQKTLLRLHLKGGAEEIGILIQYPSMRSRVRAGNPPGPTPSESLSPTWQPIVKRKQLGEEVWPLHLKTFFSPRPITGWPRKV